MQALATVHALSPVATSLQETVDELGRVKADIAALEKAEKSLSETLKAQGAGKHEGLLFNASVIEAERETVDWKTICACLCAKHDIEVSSQLLTAHTKKTPVVTVRVSSK